MVQLDTLNPAGRSHDIFFFSRMNNYKVEDFLSLYKEKKVFEYFFPNLHGLHIDAFPLFNQTMGKSFLDKRNQKFVEVFDATYPNLQNKLLNYLANVESINSSDIKKLAELKEFVELKDKLPFMKPLEVLFMLGKITVKERDHNFRKTFTKTENYHQKENDNKISDILLQKLILRLRSYPVILTKFRSQKHKDYVKPKNLRHLDILINVKNPEDDKVSLIKLDDTNYTFIVPVNWKSLLKESYDNNLRAIAPLDPIVWDRGQLNLIFDFDYVWEVYKPANKRKFGYYVYPLLFQDKFVGKLECKYTRKSNNLKLFNINFESNYQKDDFDKPLSILSESWKTILSADEVEIDYT